MPQDTFVPLKHPLGLRYFHEVASAGSFRKASERAHVAASAINRHVKHLEEDMGTLLFERGRGRGGLKLTAAGEVLLYRLKRAESELTMAHTEIDSLLGLKRGTVVFGVNEGIWREVLPRILANFRKQHPGINHRITVGASPALVDLLLEDEIDFALAFNPVPNPRMVFAAKRTIGACVMARRGHPLAARKSVRLTDCAEYDLVMPDHSLALRSTLDRLFGEAGLTPRAVVTTNSYEVMRSAAAAGIGLAILTQQVFAQRDSEVSFVPLREPRIAPQILACCTRAERSQSAASLAMIGAVGQALALSAARSSRRQQS